MSRIQRQEWVYHMDAWQKRRHVIEEQYWIGKFLQLEIIEYAELVAQNILTNGHPHTLIIVAWGLELPYTAQFEKRVGRLGQFQPVADPRMQVYESVADRFGLLVSHSMRQSYLGYGYSTVKPFYPNIELSENPFHEH